MSVCRAYMHMRTAIARLTSGLPRALIRRRKGRKKCYKWQSSMRAHHAKDPAGCGRSFQPDVDLMRMSLLRAHSPSSINNSIVFLSVFGARPQKFEPEVSLSITFQYSNWYLGSGAGDWLGHDIGGS